MSMMRARGQNKARHREPIVANEEAFSYFVHSVTFFWVVCFMLAYRNIVADAVVDFFLDVS